MPGDPREEAEIPRLGALAHQCVARQIHELELTNYLSKWDGLTL